MIPNSRIPWTYVDFDNSKAIATGGGQTYQVLIFGQKLDGSPGPSLIPVQVRKEKDVSDLFGVGSMLHLMAKAYFESSPTSRTFILALDDPPGSVAAQWTIGIDGTFVSNVTLPLFVAGRRVEVSVTKESTNAQILLGFAEKITKDPTFPVTAVVKDNLLTLTTKNKGLVAGAIDIRCEFDSYRQPANGTKLKIQSDHNQLPLGSVSLSEGIKRIYDRQFHVLINPYLDQENLKLLDQDLSSRFSAERQLEGHMFGAVGGDEDALTKNSPYHSKHFTILASGLRSPTPDFVWAAGVAGSILNSAQEDPALPFKTLPIYSCLPDEDGARFERDARARLLAQGYSTYNVDANGVPRVERLITTYFNPIAPSDESYLAVNTLFTLSFLRYSFSNYFSAKYPRHKLADDDAIIKPGAPILTPKVAQCEAVALFLSWEEDGLVENFAQFKEDLFVERNAKDRGRLDFLMSPRLMAQLNVLGARISFLT